MSNYEYLDFNPRSHERSDNYQCSLLSHFPISIHAPTRGATRTAWSNSKRYRHFNPRSHERSDLLMPKLWHKKRISIHAPTRGATSFTIARFYVSSDFNPRSHERSDFFGTHISLTIVYFNPRSHERSDVFLSGKSLEFINFNPRSHERSDVIRLSTFGRQFISIHAPTRGATAILHKKFVYFYTIPTINI